MSLALVLLLIRVEIWQYLKLVLLPSNLQQKTRLYLKVL